MVSSLYFVICGMLTYHKSERQEVVVPSLKNSSKLIYISTDNFNRTVLWFSDIVFAYTTTLLRIISKCVMPMVTRFKNASCGAKMRVKYFSDPSLSRIQGQTIGHYVQYALLHGAWNYNTNRNNTPCYMRDSACGWFIIENTKIIRSYVEHF